MPSRHEDAPRTAYGAGPLVALACTLALAIVGCGGGQSQSGAGSSASTAASNASTTSAQASTPVARGRVLYAQDGCSACHSIDGSRLTGPSWKGLAGSVVHLSDGHTLIADDAYLRRHIVKPQAYTVAGYPGEVMAQAISQLELSKRPREVGALVAFIDSLR